MFPEIPKSTDGIDDAWLTQALQTRFPGIQIRGSQQIEHIRGTGTKLRIALNHASAGLPATLIVKAGYEPHSYLKRGMHMTETRAYRDFLPAVRVNAPDCYFAHADDNGESIILLEDLGTTAEFLSLQQPISFDLAAAFVSEMAAMHACWWGRPELEGNRFDWVPRPVQGRFLDMVNHLLAPDSFTIYRAAPRGAATPVALLDPVRIRNGLTAMRARYDGQPKVIIHGDSHLNNLYVGQDRRPGFLDWSIRVAPWQHELNYFITAALDIPDRRRWEAALLQHYFNCLRAHGIAAPDFDAGWLDYQCDTIWGFFIWLTNDASYQTESANTAAASRFAAAMLDHDVYRLLGV